FRCRYGASPPRAMASDLGWQCLPVCPHPVCSSCSYSTCYMHTHTHTHTNTQSTSSAQAHRVDKDQRGVRNYCFLHRHLHACRGAHTHCAFQLLLLQRPSHPPVDFTDTCTRVCVCVCV